MWHIDSGPHVPRPPDVPWDERIPYPVFAVASHIYLWDCPIEAGPTGVLKGSHTSGQHPPFDRMSDDDLEWNGEKAVPLVARGRRCRAVRVGRLASPPAVTATVTPAGSSCSVHYGRRDLAQRLRLTSDANQLSRRGSRHGRRPSVTAHSSGCTLRSSTTAEDRSVRARRPRLALLAAIVCAVAAIGACSNDKKPASAPAPTQSASSTQQQ